VCGGSDDLGDGGVGEGHDGSDDVGEVRTTILTFFLMNVEIHILVE